MVAGRGLVNRLIRKSLLCDSVKLCEEACIYENSFYCQGFNFRRDKVADGSCQLTSIPGSKFDMTADFNPDAGVDFYDRHQGAPKNCYRGAPPPEPLPLEPPRPPPIPPERLPPMIPERPPPPPPGMPQRPPPPPPEKIPHPPKGPWPQRPGPNDLVPGNWDRKPMGGGQHAFGLQSTVGLPDECFVRSKMGFKLDRAVVVLSVSVPSLYHCELECANEKKFNCNIFSFSPYKKNTRYSMSPAIPGDNCHLGERNIETLDPYTDILPDRDYDLYERNKMARPNCQPKKQMGSDCFERVRTGLKIDDSMAKYSLNAGSLSECEAACLHIPYFTCRAFSFRYGPPIIGQQSDNCLLTDWPAMELDPRKHFTVDPGCELYNRGSYGHGCEINRHPDKGSPPRPEEPPIRPSPPDMNRFPEIDRPGGRPPPGNRYPPERYPPPDRDHYGGRYPDRYPDRRPFPEPGRYPDRMPYPTDVGHHPGDRYPDRFPGGSRYPPQRYPESNRWPESGHFHGNEVHSQFPPERPSNSYLPVPKPDGPPRREPPYIPPRRPYPDRGAPPPPPPPPLKPSPDFPDRRPGHRPPQLDHMCYIKHMTGARLLPSAIRTSIRVANEEECQLECTRLREQSMFRCATFSWGGNHCELSDIEQRDLRPGYDFMPDKEYWMFTWDFDTGECNRNALPPPKRPPTPVNKVEEPNGMAGLPNGDKGVESTWSRFTVNGQPCRAGTYCRMNPDVGVWTCPVDNGDWDYCCRSGHHCGYSDKYPYPWCYVGSAEKDQWRPCSDSYYPYSHSGRKLHWPVAYLHREGPPNITEVHQPSIVDSFLETLKREEAKRTSTTVAQPSTIPNVTLVDLPAPKRTSPNSRSRSMSEDSLTAMSKLWSWGQETYNASTSEPSPVYRHSTTPSPSTTPSTLTTPLRNSTTTVNR